MQTEIDAANAGFWDFLCGASLADHIGIKDHLPESLARFDAEYFRTYPYLLPIVGIDRLQGKKVLEVGLGYGTLGQRLAEVCSEYSGLDIAAKPVAMMNYRLQMKGLPGKAVQGNSLAMPFADQTFDQVVSIGCFHHTGNFEKCIEETYRVLKPDGVAVIMIYNKYSIRQWTTWPLKTARMFVGDLFSSGTKFKGNEEENAAYDGDPTGKGPPETEFLSKRDLKRILKQFRSVTFMKRNCDGMLIRNGNFLLSRERLLPIIGPWLGLDIYFEARKSAA